MNNLNNLPPFYIGQKVVYITGNCMSKDSIHIVKNILKYPCGCYYLDVGLISVYSVFTKCIDHDSCLSTNDNIRYFLSTSFRPLEQQSFPLISMSKILEKELICAN